MAGWIVLTRRVAAVKLESAKKATYYFQRGERRYERAVTVPEMAFAFSADPRARLRIRLSDSRHVVTLVERPELRTGYVVEF